MARFTIDGKRYDTEKMNDLGISTLEQRGVNIEAVYMTTNSKRVFVQTYSIWDRGDGCVVGTRFHQATESEIGQLADEHDSDELRELLPDDSD